MCVCVRVVGGVGNRLLTSANGVEMRFNSGNGYPATSTKLYSKNGHLFLTKCSVNSLSVVCLGVG